MSDKWNADSRHSSVVREVRSERAVGIEEETLGRRGRIQGCADRWHRPTGIHRWKGTVEEQDGRVTRSVSCQNLTVPKSVPPSLWICQIQSPSLLPSLASAALPEHAHTRTRTHTHTHTHTHTQTAESPDSPLVRPLGGDLFATWISP